MLACTDLQLVGELDPQADIICVTFTNVVDSLFGFRQSQV